MSSELDVRASVELPINALIDAPINAPVDVPDRLPLNRFLDSFFQERNIKWILALGMLILLGSSLMFVTSHWHESTPVGNYLILLAYMAAVGVCGDVCYWRLGLRKTGTVLMSLTVLLLPISFLALRWIRPGDPSISTDWGGSLGLALLLGLNFAGSAVAARRIFRHFLCSSQPVFVASYLVLCLAGAVCPGLPPNWAPWVATGLWAVFSVGTIKVNRHIFWLTEEHRLPRIFGFFPILLLGTQFITLFAVNFAALFQWQWMGFGCMLVAVPVLATADQVARVYQQRTGDLVRPWPWSIVLPFLVGLALCAGGVCLSMTNMPRPMALVPTAALGAGLMALMAHRLRKPGLVWAMLLGILFAYQYSPLFFLEFARSVVARSASAVREPQLPYAFYGLTYLPLLAALIGTAFQLDRSGVQLFARPIRRFAIGLAGLLLCAAVGHSKAMFPSGLALTVVFAAQTLLFRDRRLIVPALVASIVASLGFTPFAGNVLGLTVPRDSQWLCLACLAALQFYPGRLLDRWSTELSPPGQRESERDGSNSAQIPQRAAEFCQLSSLLVTLYSAGLWFWEVGLDFPFPPLSGAMLSALLVLHTLKWLTPGLGETAILFTGFNLLIGAARCSVEADIILFGSSMLLIGLWFAADAMRARLHHRFCRAFCSAAGRVSLTLLTMLLLFVFCPWFLLAADWGCSEAQWIWMSAAAVIAWSFDVARRPRRAGWAAFGCWGVLGFVAAILRNPNGWDVAWSWIPAAWAATACAAIPVIVYLGRRLDARTSGLALTLPETELLASRKASLWIIEAHLLCVLGCTAVTSIALLTDPLRVAGLLSLAGLFSLGLLQQRVGLRQMALVLANWQGLGFVLCLFAPTATCILNIDAPPAASGVLPLALCSAISVLAFQFWRGPAHGKAGYVLTSAAVGARLTDAHRFLLWLFFCFCLLASLFLAPAVLPPVQAAVALLAFAALVSSELWAACRDQTARRVWSALFLLSATVGYLWLRGVITFGSGLGLYVVLSSGFLLWTIAHVTERSPRTRILAGPLAEAGMALPLVAVLVGIARHAAFANATWLGSNSLALLLAAAFYFWRGLDTGNKWLTLLAAGILNVALTLLWRDLHWSDPQFFMIPLGLSLLGLLELLKSEVPEKLHDPLRYLGALVILVSPVFHIVGGSWIHLFSLMVASVGITLLSIGLRVRALMYTGTAFLVADILAMVVRGSIDQTEVLWIAGLLLGGAILALAAICENHREGLLQRLRILASELDAWE